ncbi:division/cell wall cluster transcriptional repressor MraZ [Caldanaerobius polysaccharolyticus]|uniref:division/cell wall cluster transcriptional repressor MraZ n=1 Tax=Caldanaerobius polysaccharolyticus TaxID=44256 RepID=UPI000478880E|nr:division/cell wall cluster transcriptional repressor MraZ [Caldanaerobius polysaccharolyticus]
MFFGEYQHTMDSKGRVIMPSKFREGLGDTFIITKGLDECLFVYSLSEWERIEHKLKELPLNKKDARAFMRFFFAGASQCEVDKQGRVLIPQNLREYASLKKDLMIIGVSTRVEIWSLDKWQKYVDDTDVSFEEIAENLENLEI